MSTMRDHLGRDIPTKYISKIDKDKHRTVNRLAKKATALQDKLTSLKSEMLEQADRIFKDMLETGSIKPEHKGNMTITSFDKEIKMEVKMQEKMEFNDNINLAHAKLKEFIELKTKGTDHDLQELISHAFSPTRGKLDTRRILSLMSMKINHPTWKAAIDLIKDSIEMNHSKRYVRIFQKNTEGEYKEINLNISSLSI